MSFGYVVLGFNSHPSRGEAAPSNVLIQDAAGNDNKFTTTIGGLVSAYASNSFSRGSAVNSIEDIVKSIPEILSETSQVSPISVVASLRREFPNIDEISVFRGGDPEMRRGRNNPLGVDSGAADIVVTTSTKPSVTRLFTPAHIELTVDEDGVLFNGTHRLGYAYRQHGSLDEEDGIQADEIMNRPAYVECMITDPTVTGALSIINSGLKTDSTTLTSPASADDEVQRGLTILE